jgi:hypothetical protein
MALRVFVVCTKCHRQREVWIAGPWDLKAVHHDCDKTEWRIEFDPPR